MILYSDMIYHKEREREREYVYLRQESQWSLPQQNCYFKTHTIIVTVIKSEF